jgi:hypothetical protein
MTTMPAVGSASGRLLAAFFVGLRALPNRPPNAILVETTLPTTHGAKPMNFDTSSRVPVFAVPHAFLPDDVRKVANTTFAGYSMRAVANVQAWRSYLPADCVTTMIEMGWDRST